MYKGSERERARERKRKTERETEREIEREMEGERERERESEREKERERERDGTWREAAEREPCATGGGSCNSAVTFFGFFEMYL